MRTVVVYPGRFQPMLSHHAEVYRALLNKYASNDVYVATTDKVEPPKSPFNFLEKQSLITLHGVKPSHVLRVRNPYNWQDYTEFFSEDSTVMIFVLGPKDAERLRGTKTDPDTGLALKKDGSPAHIQDIQFLKDDPQPMSRRVYVELAPRISDDQGQDLSASQFREKIKSAASERAAKKIFTQEFGGYDESAFHLVYRKIKGTQAMNEHLNQLRKLAGLSEAGPIHFGGSEADPTRAKFTKKPESGSEPDAYSISKRFPPGADVTDPAQRKEQFLKELSTSPNALLGEINSRLDPKDDNSLAVGERLSNVMAQLDDNHTRITSLNSDDRDFVIKLVARAIKELELGDAPTSAEAEPEEPDQEADQEADQTAPAPARESRDFMRHLLAIMEQMGEKWVIHKGKHEPGEKSSLAGQTLYGVTVKDFYTDRKEAQEHADIINAGRGYKPEDAQNPLYGGVLYIVSPAKSMGDELTEGPDDTFDTGLAEILKQRGYTGPVAIKELSPDWQDSLGRLLDDDDLIMVQGDDPEYDGWVAFMGGSKYAYGAEMGYHKGNAKQVERHTRNQQGMTEGAEDQKLGTLAREIEMQVGAHFPDSEGLEAIMSRARKIYGFDRNYPEHMLMDLIDAAAKKHLGSNDFYSYVEDFHAQHASDNPENMYEQGVAEGFWQDAVKKAEAEREARKGKPFEKNPASHDKQGVYKGDKDLAGNPVPKRKKQGVAEGAPELLKQEMPLVRHIEKELAQHGYEKGTPEYDQMLKHSIAMYRKFGNIDAIKKGIAEGHADQQRKIFKKNGTPVGEVGIDRESSPGVGQWYMKCYAYDIDKSGYDSYEEAVAELKYCLKQGAADDRRRRLQATRDFNRSKRSGMMEQGVAEGATTFGTEKFSEIMNALETFDDSANLITPHHKAAYADLTRPDVISAIKQSQDVGDIIDVVIDEYHDYAGDSSYDSSNEFRSLLADLEHELESIRGQSMSESQEDDEDEDDGTSGKFRDEWGRDTEEQDQWKKNVTGKKNKPGMSESQEDDDDDESVYYDDEDGNVNAGIDWDEEEQVDEQGMAAEASGDLDHGIDHADDDHDNLVAEFDRGYALYNKSAEPKRHVLKRNGKIVDGYYGDTKSVMGHMRWLGMREQGKKAQPSPEEMPMPESRIDLTQVLEDYGVAEAKKPKKSDGNLANNYPPYDKVTKGDVIAGRLGKDQKGGKGDQVAEQASHTANRAVSQALAELRKLAGLS